MDVQVLCEKYPGFLKDILNGLRQAIILTSLEGRVLDASEVVDAVTGFTPELLIGENLSLLFTAEDLEYLYPNLLFLGRRNKSYEGEVLLKKKNGHRFFAYLTLHTYMGSNGESLLAFCLQDIEKQKQFEKTLRETRFDDMIKIANGIAHELRNPLVGIGGFAGRLFKSCRANLDQEKYYDYIVDNVRRIENLVKKVNLLVSLPSPQFRLTSVPRIIEQAVEPYQAEIANRHIRFNADTHNLNILVDEDMAVRALAVLIENALEAVKENGAVRVYAEQTDGLAKICVADDGCGVNPEDIPYIFNPFFSTKPSGAGIDLAVVRRIMESHHGQAGVESRPGEGATFHLIFPLERRRSIRTSLISE